MEAKETFQKLLLPVVGGAAAIGLTGGFALFGGMAAALIGTLVMSLVGVVIAGLASGDIPGLIDQVMSWIKQQTPGLRDESLAPGAELPSASLMNTVGGAGIEAGAAVAPVALTGAAAAYTVKWYKKRDAKTNFNAAVDIVEKYKTNSQSITADDVTQVRAVLESQDERLKKMLKSAEQRRWGGVRGAKHPKLNHNLNEINRKFGHLVDVEVTQTRAPAGATEAENKAQHGQTETEQNHAVEAETKNRPVTADSANRTTAQSLADCLYNDCKKQLAGVDFLDPHAERLLHTGEYGNYANKLLSKNTPQIQSLGAHLQSLGLHSFTYLGGGQDTLALGAIDPEGKAVAIRIGGKMDFPKSQHMLQPISATVIANRSVVVVEQATLNVGPKEAARLIGQAYREGFTLPDIHPSNIGRTATGRIVVIDPGAIALADNTEALNKGYESALKHLSQDTGVSVDELRTIAEQAQQNAETGRTSAAGTTTDASGKPVETAAASEKTSENTRSQSGVSSEAPATEHQPAKHTDADKPATQTEAAIDNNSRGTATDTPNDRITQTEAASRMGVVDDTPRVYGEGAEARPAHRDAQDIAQRVAAENLVQTDVHPRVREGVAAQTTTAYSRAGTLMNGVSVVGSGNIFMQAINDEKYDIASLAAADMSTAAGSEALTLSHQYLSKMDPAQTEQFLAKLSRFKQISPEQFSKALPVVRNVGRALGWAAFPAYIALEVSMEDKEYRSERFVGTTGTVAASMLATYGIETGGALVGGAVGTAAGVVALPIGVVVGTGGYLMTNAYVHQEKLLDVFDPNSNTKQSLFARVHLLTKGLGPNTSDEMREAAQDLRNPENRALLRKLLTDRIAEQQGIMDINHSPVGAAARNTVSMGYWGDPDKYHSAHEEKHGCESALTELDDLEKEIKKGMFEHVAPSRGNAVSDKVERAYDIYKAFKKENMYIDIAQFDEVKCQLQAAQDRVQGTEVNSFASLMHDAQAPDIFKQREFDEAYQKLSEMRKQNPYSRSNLMISRADNCVTGQRGHLPAITDQEVIDYLVAETHKHIAQGKVMSEEEYRQQQIYKLAQESTIPNDPAMVNAIVQALQDKSKKKPAAQTPSSSERFMVQEATEGQELQPAQTAGSPKPEKDGLNKAQQNQV